MEMKFSRGTVENLKGIYPWLNENDFNLILNVSEVRLEPIDVYGNDEIYQKPRSCELVIPDLHAIAFDIAEQVIDLFPDEGGVIYSS